MLEIKLGRVKHDTGFRLPLCLTAECDTAAYGYGEMQLASPLTFTGQAENKEGEIQVEGLLKAALTLICSRCGLPFEMTFALPLTEIYSANAVAPDEDGEQDKHSFSGDNIDITPEALRLLFEQLPMKPVCKDDCQGLCPVCGADLNHKQCACAEQTIDPRWEKLKNLLQDDPMKGV